MAKSVEEEVRELKEKNNALVQKVQYWKMTAAQREEEKIDLMKELNQLRLAICHYRSSSSSLDSVLDSAVQELGEQTLTRLVQVSSAITRTVDVMKTYIRKKQEVDRDSPSGKLSLRDSPNNRGNSKVLRVVPMIRGRAIGKPIILLQPIDATQHVMRREESEDTSEQEHEATTPPQHVLQDVYIPLHRIDAETARFVNMRRRTTLPLDEDADVDNSLEVSDLRMQEDDESLNEAELEERDGPAEDGASEREESFTNRRSMETLIEENEDENWSPQVILTRDLHQASNDTDNPLEGPSWLLNQTSGCTDSNNQTSNVKSEQQTQPIGSQSADISTAGTLEPDSTTDASQPHPGPSNPAAPDATSSPILPAEQQLPSVSPTCVYTPTVRVKRKRSRMSSPRLSFALVDEMWSPPKVPNSAQINNSSGSGKDPTKVLVMVSKMSLDELSGRTGHGSVADMTPQRRSKQQLEAPSPNGSTLDAGLIVIRESTAQVHTSSEIDESVRTTSERPKRSRSAAAVHQRNRRESALHDVNYGEICNRNRLKRSNSTHDRTTNEPDRDSCERESVQKLVRKKPNKNVHHREKSQNSSRNEVSEREESAGAGSSREGSAGGDTSERLASSEESESETRGPRGRAKRPRKVPPNYKEKPLNRKLRR